mgnify:CR=1 FL=1
MLPMCQSDSQVLQTVDRVKSDYLYIDTVCVLFVS